MNINVVLISKTKYKRPGIYRSWNAGGTKEIQYALTFDIFIQISNEYCRLRKITVILKMIKSILIVGITLFEGEKMLDLKNTNVI